MTAMYTESCVVNNSQFIVLFLIVFACEYEINDTFDRIR